MRSIFLLLFSITAFIVSSCSNGQTQSANTNLSANEFANKIKEIPSAPVIDVRTPEEFTKGHIQNAINIDWNGNDFQNQISKFDKSKPVFVYCLSGGRSSAAAKYMRSMGFKQVYELNGGIMQWRSANLPEVTDVNHFGLSKLQFEQLTQSDKLVLIDFYADWCGPCKKMKPFLDEISTEMSDKLVLVRINADENQQLCKELNIDVLPVLQLYKNNTLIWTNKGFISKDNLLKKLQY